jgi:WD40 repeat protein
VKVLDFGLARAIDEADRLTQEGAVVGTPAYMAPEQARGEPVDARADLFSLGCVVYEMLTGRRPFRGPTTFAILTALATARPPAPRDLDPAIPADLSDFAMSLLEKDPARRPASAGAVADRARALARTGPASARIVVQPLPDENPWDTLAAGDPGALTRGADRAATTQMADPPARRRSPALRYALTAGGAVVVLGLAVGLLLKTRGGADPGPEVSKARKAEPPPAPEAVPVDATVWDRLDRATIPLAERVVGQPAEVVGVYNSHRQRDWYSMLGLAVHPAGKYVLTGNQTGPYLRLWHPETLDLMATVRNLGGHTAPVFSRDGRRLATLSQMGRQINLWAADGKQPVPTTSHVVPDGGRCTYLAFTPSGETLLSMSEGRTPVYLWDLRADPPKPTPVPDSGPTETHYFHRLAVSPDGRRLAAARGLGADGLGLWDLTADPPRKLATFGRHQGPVSALSFSGDGARLYTGAVSNEVFVWDVTRSPPRELGQVGTWPGSGKTMFANGVFGVRETPDGKALLVADVAHVRLFEIAGGTYQFKSTVLFDHGPAFDLAVGPDGRTGYVSTAEGNAILAVRLEDGELRRGPDPGTKKLYSPGGGHRFALTPGRAGFAYSTGPTVEAAELLDTGDWRTTTLIPDGGHQFHTALDWHPGLGRFETTGYNVRHGGHAGLLFRQAAAGPAAELFVDKDAKNFRTLARSPDGRLLAVGSVAGDLLLFVPAAETYRVRHRFPKQDGAVTSVGFSADGKYLAAVAQGPVHVWDVSGPEPTLAHSFRKKHDWAHLAFSPTGRVLAVTDNNQGFALVNLDDPKEGLHLLSNQRTSFAAFHPTKPWVAAAHLGVTVWNYQTNRVEQSWSWSFPGPVNSLAFTPEGRHLLTANGNSTVYVLRLEKLSAVAKP